MCNSATPPGDQRCEQNHGTEHGATLSKCTRLRDVDVGNRSRIPQPGCTRQGAGHATSPLRVG